MDRRGVIIGLSAGGIMLALKPFDLNSLEVELFIIAGQSNASGRGLENELPSSFPYAKRTKIFTNAWTWADGYEPTDDESVQVDTVSIDNQANKASFGMAFASGLAAVRTNKIIGLIPCARGSSSLTENWSRNLSRSTLYGSMIARAKAARAFGTVKGMLWYQGESDAHPGKQALAESYAADWLAWSQNVCDDLEDQDLKFIVTELGPSPGIETHPYWSTVQAQQQTLDGARDGNVSVVSAADLDGKEGDEVHLDTASLLTLGGRYATAMQALLTV